MVIIMDILKIFLTAVMSVAALFFITKLMGHKQVSQLDFFDYISGITIGSIAAELATELEEPMKPLIALAVYGAVSIALSVITNKFPRTRKYINGTPAILMKGGKIYRKNLKKAKLDLSEFLLMCRELGYFDLEDIHTAVFEPNGKLSVLPRSARRPITPEDMKIPAKQEHIGTEVIMDGRIMGENLGRLGIEEALLFSALRSYGYESPREVILGIYHEDDGSFRFYPLA